MSKTYMYQGIISMFVVLVLMFVFAATAVQADTTGDLLPNGDGTYTQFTDVPSAGSDDYVEVDESVCDGKSTYLKANKKKTGWRSSVTVDLSSIPAGAIIESIEVKPCASRHSKKKSGTSVMDVFYRLNGVNSVDAGGYALPAKANVPVELNSHTFDGLSTMKTGSTTLEIGVVYTSGNRGVRLSRLAADVSYSLPSSAPEAPTNLQAYASSTSAQLYWTDNADNEDSFDVERSTDGSAYSVIGTTGANQSWFSDYSVTSSSTYYYRVRAENNEGYSDYSNVASVFVW